MRRLIFLSLLLFFFVRLPAQHLLGIAEIPVVDSACFYKIKISSELAGLLADGCANARIYGAKHRELAFRFLFDTLISRLPDPKVNKLSSEYRKHSRFEIKFKQVYAIHHLQIKAKNAFYHRDASLKNGILRQRVRLFKRKHEDHQYQFQTNFDLCSAKKTDIIINQNADCLQLEVDDRDDQPLEQIECNAWSLDCYFVAYLKPHERYELNIFLEDIGMPSYDIENIDINDLKLRQIHVLKYIPKPQQRNVRVPDWSSSALWLVLCVLGVGMTWMVTKMAKKRTEI